MLLFTKYTHVCQFFFYINLFRVKIWRFIACRHRQKPKRCNIKNLFVYVFKNVVYTWLYYPNSRMKTCVWYALYKPIKSKKKFS